ncbi:MAG TPA: hypothetical protein VFC33_12110 [Acidimicrobiia bacterium]|nr:hypothetical protein [Acidimicrobiia bacterium]
MTRARRDPLRWYPAAWRARYGDELRALIEDHAGGDGPRLRERASLAGHGLVERARALFLLGPGVPEESRWRGGALLVLIAWAVFMIGGAGFSKSSEHFAASLPAGARTLPRAAFDVVSVAAVVGGLLVVTGALLAGPAFVRFVRAGGWASLRGHVTRAVVVTVVLVASTIPLVLWAHDLPAHARNGGSVGYGVAFLAWVALAVTCLAAWTVVAVTVGRHVLLTRRVLRCEAALALALAVVMVVVTAATATWWGAMAASAPWFLAGTPRGTTGTALDVPLAVAMAVMVAGLAVSTAGALRIARR